MLFLPRKWWGLRHVAVGHVQTYLVGPCLILFSVTEAELYKGVFIIEPVRVMTWTLFEVETSVQYYVFKSKVSVTCAVNKF